MFGDFMNRALLEFNIDKDCLLIDFLKCNIEKSKNNIKSFISNGCCYVNDLVITKYSPFSCNCFPP